ncbi:FliM/FliN family flagellar motor switch protein [Thioclava sp. 15-R06ZXC-3]|uniref:Flagellar motor switch protein FliN n=1 Tax=Thioclava arctica TaxID=3238301 RepID=A0ABV3TPR5_9RHOB
MTNKKNEPSDQAPVQVDPLEPPVDTAGAARAIPATTVDSVRVTMVVEIGRVNMTIKELRGTRQGTVIPLDRAIGEPIDIRANGSLIARGEVVSTEGHKYGIRVTEIVGTDDSDHPA